MLRVSVLELPARWGERDAAIEEVDRLLADAPTDLAVLPELAFTGYVSPGGDFDAGRFAEPLDGPTVRAATELARRHRTALVAPLVLAEGVERYNTAILISEGGVVAEVYRKRHPWFPERWATAGRDAPPLVRVGPLTVTIAICFDAQFLHEEGAAFLAPADLLLFPSAWVDEEETRIPLLQSVARRFGVAIANANWAPGVVEVPGQGGSCIVGPRGELLSIVEPGGRPRADAVILPASDGARSV